MQGYTIQEVTISFRDYGNIIIPTGTKTTHRTAMGTDKNYNFVDEFGWIKNNYPQIDLVLEHDAKYYGINVPSEYVRYS